jgi:ankyrin repeat protein
MNTWIEPLKHNDQKKVKELVESGEDVNATNESGESVLMYALRSHCDDELISYLIQSGADIFATDHEGVSVFDMAITYNNIKMVKYLLDKGVDVNTTHRKSGFTSLMCASCYGRLEIAKLLLENGAKVKTADFSGLNAVDYSRKMNKKSIYSLLQNV